MKVVIPVAGVGNRLKPHTLTQPKPLLHVAGKPILAYILEPLAALEPEEVVFVIGFKGDQIRKFVQDNYSFKATFVYQEELLGLGYALSLAVNEIGDSPTLVVLGDTIVECDLAEFVKAGENVLGVRRVEDPQRFGIVEISDGVVSGVVEKPQEPKTDLALIGLYYFEKTDILGEELTKIVKAGKTTDGEIQLTDALSGMIDRGIRFTPYHVDDWYDCGKKETVLASNRHFLKRLQSPACPEGCVIIPPVYIAPTARVSNSILGPDVSVSDEAVVVDSVVRNSIIGTRARLDKVVIEDSLVGRRARVKGRQKILNIGDSSEIEFI